MRPKLIPILISGLPLGLIVLGAIAMWLYFNDGSDVVEPSAEMGAILRREISAAEIDRYSDIFSDVLGPRSPDDPAALRRTANYLESTLGPRNLGYAVFRSAPGEEDTVVAYQRGGDRPREVVIVAAPYSAEPHHLGERSAALALLMTVAGAKTGTFVDRSIAFVLTPAAVVNRDSAQRAALEAMHLAGTGVVVALLVPGPDLAVPAAAPTPEDAEGWASAIAKFANAREH
ncbi:hypothetical protein BH23VER1_BH23VER1_12370 [soil metagenome]